MAQIDLGKVVGRSAYEIAVQNGFEGTEQEWSASLKGPKGEPGKDAESYQILTSKDAVQENAEAGKLVDALVVKEVFQSVSEGKEAIASAITDKGVQTDAGDSFAVMAGNIRQIQGGSGSGNETMTFNYQGVFSGSNILNLRHYFDDKMIKKIILKRVKISGKKEVSNASSTSIRFELYAQKDGRSQEVRAAYFTHSVSSTSYTNTQKENIEIDMSEYDRADYIRIYTGKSSGTVYYYDFTAEGEIEVYF